MDWIYTDKVRDHFQNPRNILDDDKTYSEDGKGYVGNAKCGDMMLVVIKVDKEKQIITECKWKTYGCASAIASTSALSVMVVGMSLEEAYRVKPQDIMNQLEGLPTHKIHCSVLGDKALRNAIDDFYSRNGMLTMSQKSDERTVCYCLNVTEGDIRKKVVEEGVKTFEDLQKHTKISTSCGNCEKEARTLFDEFLLLNNEDHHD